MTRKTRALWCPLAAVVIAAVAAAEETGDGQPAVDKSMFHLFNPTPSAYLRELDVDGPGNTASPHTVDAGHFQVEMDLVSYTSDRESRRGLTRRLDAWTIAPVNLKVGVLNQLDAELILETWNLVHERAGRSRVTRRGFGDITARLKYNFWGNDSGRTAFAAMPYVKFPTNEEHIGNHSVEGGLILPLEVTVPWDFGMGLMMKFDAVRDDDNRGYHTEFVNSVDVGHDLFGKLSGYVEFLSAASTERGAGWVATFDPGLIYVLTRNMQLDAGVNIGLTRPADDWNPFVGVAWRSGPLL